MTLEQTLKNASYKVWGELDPIPKSESYKIFEVRKEALTTMAIKEIYRSTCPLIDRVEMIPGSEESLKGYDFELAIGSKKLGKYVRLFIQAKRLYGKETKCNFDAMDFSQTNALISYSRDHTSLGMYAFYNHLAENDLRLQQHYNSATPFDRKSMGITIASAYSVKMLHSKKFKDYHCNNNSRISPNLYSLRYFNHLLYFQRESKKHIAVPFHELTYFTIELAEFINRLYRRIRVKGRSFFFFFFIPGTENFFNGEQDLITILRTSSEKLISDFRNRTSGQQLNDEGYNPQALIILETGEEMNKNL